MTDIVLNAINSGYNLSKINDNFQKIEDKINDEILHLTGGNNVLEQDLDVNSNRVINLPVPVSNTEPVRYKEFQELKTSAIVSENVGTIDDIVALSNIDTSALVDGQQFSVASYLPDTSTGSCLLRWRPDLPKSRHDGVLFFSLTVPIFTGTDTTDYRNGVGETDSGGNGVMELVRGEIIYDATVLVPSHYENPQDALDFLGASISMGSGATVSVNLSSGFSLEVPIEVRDRNYSALRITSDDEFVPVHDDFPVTGRIISGFHCYMPRINCSFDGRGIAERGINAFYSHVFVAPGEGVKNCTDRNFYALSCPSCVISGSVWSGSGWREIWATRVSSLIAEDCHFSDSQDSAIFISRVSSARLIGSTFTNVAGTCLEIGRDSTASAPNCTFTDCGSVGNTSGTGRLNIEGSTATGITGRGILVRGGLICARETSIGAADGNSSRGMEAEGGVIDFKGGTITNFGDTQGLASDGGRILGSDSTVIGGGISPRGYWANDGGEIIAVRAQVTGHTIRDLQIAQGSKIAANSCSTTNGSGSPDIGDVGGTSAFNANNSSGIVYA